MLLVTVLGFKKEDIKSGLYSFNSLLLGIGFGTFFGFSFAFWLWLSAACLLCVVLSVNLTSLLGKYALPGLSIPFVLTFWMVLIAANGYLGMGLLQKGSSLIFELNANPPSRFAQLCHLFDHLSVPAYVLLFFRSVSAILFQNSVLAGIIISIGFFIHSRIGFSLLVIGFITACVINHLTGTYPEGISNYHLGANFMMVSCAIGGFFLIPSWRSYLWAIAVIPFTFLVLNGLSRILVLFNLPVFSLPFCLVTIGLLYFFMLRKKAGKLQLTPLQHYSPETNLYQFLNGQYRLKDFKYFNFSLPFMGAWTVSQGYEGEITHKGDWQHALDFVLKDIDNKSYQLPGLKLEDYYCFNKPVLAVGDGVVKEVIGHVDDNAIGQVNLQQNWGNTIVIKHAENLYSKVSHLKKNSIKVKVGDYVKQGDIIALCGNSGRSPEPHLHFQVQCTPYIGSKTYPYPIAYFTSANQAILHSFEIPEEGSAVERPEINPYLKNAFHFQPGYIASATGDNGQVETWEVFTDDFNATYFFCQENQAVAYFVSNANIFYFTRFYGDKNALLFRFYQIAYKVNYSAQPVADRFAIDAESFNPALWLQDILAPFYSFVRHNYCNSVKTDASALIIHAAVNKQLSGGSKQLSNGEIFIGYKGIKEFAVQYKNKHLKVKWETSSV
ncbi:peptidoglycan DD-metalloendopeptidase family protein [Pedobacter sp. HDW13]|uniref:urea transporter n=1 Tax=Pedobacter sp. HDW13 TaxID=2714940 RepID=UPI00140804C8|nr:urea transporter [Pedobacter sp. HDW13]QIL39782.1 peptidoglycan DD-metalloendopeptidase family protein [Pedobacter sp. HDW13]